MMLKKTLRIAILILCMGLTVLQSYTQQPSSVRARSGKIRVASCQFPVSADIRTNCTWMMEQITEASLKKADIVHFPECALSGYPGSDMETLDGFDWETLYRCTDSILNLASRLRIWVVFGSMHRLSDGHKPHNSLYVVNDKGQVIDRYDKRFCTGGDLDYFTPGDHFVTFSLNGVTCGLLICYDVRFPELYRAYRKLNCNLILQSFYNARQQKGSIHPVIMPVSSQAHAATNYFYMSLTNSSAPESWPCHFITPDGLVQNKLAFNVPGILISEVDLSEQFYDASGDFRDGAIDGKLNSGETIADPRSQERKSLR